MSILKNIQNKPREEKIRIMWAVVAIVAVFLIAVWIISYRFNKYATPDTTLFDSIGKGIKDVKDNYGKK